MRQSLKIIFAICSFILCFSVCYASTEKDDFVVVIDPGHGGHDHGALGRITNEKTINLKVGLLLRDLLDNADGIKTVMTRDNDSYLKLQERADIANRAKGDLFISIHVNSLDKRSRKRNTIEGASVYTLGLHKTADNFDVAKRENAVIALEPDFTTTYHGFDPNSSESYIIFEMSQNRHMTHSIEFASTVQSYLVSSAGRADRGVRQAGFWVLMATSMPAVLVELDYICNPKIEKYLNSKSGQKKIAQALYKAIMEFTQHGTNVVHPDKIDMDTDTTSTLSKNQSKAHGITDTEYKIQILASTKLIKANSTEFKGLRNIEHHKEHKLYKYTVGHYTTQTDAEKALKKIKRKFPSAFITEWHNGQKKKH